MSLRRPESVFSLDPILLVILAVAAFLLFFRLDHRPFWQDEAETACLARNVLKYGVPKAFDGVNLISQEEGREFDADYIWRWSPWLQIYLAAGAFKVGGLTTWAGRFPFAAAGLACIWLVYFLIKRRFGDLAWARLAAALLTTSLVFIMFSRQCRYCSLGAFLALASLYAFRGPWQSRFGPAALLVISLGSLFYANYLLFLSYAAPFLIAALLVYRRELPVYRTLFLSVLIVALTLPGLFLFRLQQQSGMLNFTLVPRYLELYFADLFQFMVPLPVVLGLLWRWRGAALCREGLPGDPEEKFVMFLSLIILGNIAIIALVPQRQHRYLLHLYPLCAMLLGWAVIRVYRYQKFSGVLLGLLLLFTNWLHLVPMDWLGIANRPPRTDFHMLTYPNLPLKLYLTELFSSYPDVNQSLIRFFQREGRPGETILVTYGDLPLQFYTPFKVVGGLQWRQTPPGDLPPWVVKRCDTRLNREKLLSRSEELILHYPRLFQDYQAIVLPYPDELFGNRADPYYHHFVPPAEPFTRLVVYRKRAKGSQDAPL
jgi:hypothetical protein